MIGFTRTDTSILSRWWWTVDRWMLLALGLLVATGALLVLAASPAVAERFGSDSFYFARRQMVFLPLGLALMLGFSLLSPRWVRRVGCILFIVFLALTMIAALVGPEYNGARRWLSIAGFALQPSEFLKPMFAVVAAWMFSEQHRGQNFPGNKIAMAFYALVVLALVSQPDFGQTLLVSAVWGVQFFLAGLATVWVVALVAGVAVGLVCAYLTVPYVAGRIDRFFEPASGDTYQIDTALDAFRIGGLFGRGPGEGVVKRVLPDAHSDFVFAVMGEEFGILACLALIALFAFIVIRALLSLLHENDLFVFLAVAGLATMFGLQAAINLGVNVDLLPSKGMTLPFVSYGGSSVLALSMAMGMMLALTRRSHHGAGFRNGGKLVIGR